MAKTILLVEDDEDIATLLRLNLQDEGYQIVHEADGGRALARLETQVWDAVILDLMLPGVDGLEICRRIRQMTRYLPVIIISARTSEMHRVLGTEMGADDYLAKPFSLLELIARVKALFRRREAMGQNLLMDAGRLSCHGLSIDPLSREVKLRGETVDLTPREFDLLYYFARHPGKCFPARRCWSRSGDISTRAMSIPSIPISTACAVKSNVTRPSRTSFLPSGEKAISSPR